MAKMIFSTGYLPPVQYISAVAKAEEVFVELHETYAKQSYRNRCVIYGGNGPVPLTIPVIKTYGNHTKTKDIRIDYQKKWNTLHWKAISSAYRASPFFEYYKDDYRTFFNKEFDFLFDFNLALLQLVLQQLGINPVIKMTNEFVKQYPENIYDFRDVIHPKKDYNKMDINFCPVKYFQVFDDRFGFCENLSIIDVIFNHGPDTMDIVLKSRKELTEVPIIKNK
jgi:hypothetical protein